MSRAEELLKCQRPDYCGDVELLKRAEAIIRDLEAALARRDERIAELGAMLVRVREEISGFRGQFQVSVAETQDALVKSLVPVLDAARAEVPEWCREIIRLEREAYEKHHSGDAVAILCRLRILVKSLTHDQLRACGIEDP
jgi:hypothetical protein